MKTISLAAPTAYLRKHVFWVQLVSLTVLVLVAAGWIVVKAGRQKPAMRAEEARLDHAAATLSNWAATFQPAASEELAAWRQTSSETRQLGSRRDERLTLAGEIAGQAERPGFTDVRVAFEPPDSATAAPLPRAAGPYAFVLAPYRVSVNFRGDLAAARTFIGNLPAAVLVTRLKFKREGTGLRGTVTLDIYEPADGQPAIAGGAQSPSPNQVAELELLGQYLTRQPVQPRFVARPLDWIVLADSLSGLVQAGRPSQRKPALDLPRPAGVPVTRWVVSAIMITESRRVAVVNDSLVSVGAAVGRGATVAAIEPDRVILLESGGARRELRMQSGSQ